MGMMSQSDAYRELRAQGKDRGQAVRAIAWTLYGADSPLAKSYLAGFRASLRHGDNLERYEAQHAAEHGRDRGDAFSDGWALAAAVA